MVDASDYVDKGWVHARLFFEVMATDKDTTKKALENHLGTIRKMEKMKVLSEIKGDIEKVEKPPRELPEAYSQIAEVHVVVSSLENLLYAVIFFGPSSIEIMEPTEFKLDQGSAQAMLNAVAEIMHRYAAGGAGGIVINTKK